MEQEREEARAFLDSIIDNIPNMVFVKDAEHLRFVRLNSAAEDMLGFKREEMIGKSDHDLFPKEEADSFTAKDREVLASGELRDIPVEPIETRHRGKRLLHTKKMAIRGPDGNPKYLLGISEDITDRLRADEAEREAEKLRELDRLKNDFLSNVSHELRTPLVSLQGYVELLLKHDVKRDKARDWLRVVLRSSRRLEGIITGLLEISRLESGDGAPGIRVGGPGRSGGSLRALRSAAAFEQEHHLEATGRIRAASRRRRSSSLAVGTVEPGGQRHQVLAGGRHHHGGRPCRSCGGHSHQRQRRGYRHRPIRARDHLPALLPGGVIAPRASTGARESGSPWPGSSPRPTAAASGSKARLERAPGFT